MPRISSCAWDDPRLWYMYLGSLIQTQSKLCSVAGAVINFCCCLPLLSEALHLIEMPYTFHGPLPEASIDESHIPSLNKRVKKLQDCLGNAEQSGMLALDSGPILG